MNSLRTTFLQLELERIELEARTKSLAIMNKAAVLEQAHDLCAFMNAGNHFEKLLEPSVVYDVVNATCTVMVYCRGHLAGMIANAKAAGIDWNDNGKSYRGVSDYRFGGFPLVEVAIPDTEIAAYLEAQAVAA